MARFRIGMRVRIKYSLTWPYLNGTEGVIVGISDPKLCAPGHRGDWIVQPDGFNSFKLPDDSSSCGYSVFAPKESQLEPITDSYDLVSWESMRDLWVPEHLREDA